MKKKFRKVKPAKIVYTPEEQKQFAEIKEWFEELCRTTDTPQHTGSFTIPTGSRE